jgi:polysaccharide biosynthesis protein PslH
MKILWVGSLLHPTTRGGQVRTLEMLRRLHQGHEIHYVAFAGQSDGEGVQRSGEYCSRIYPVIHHSPPRRSLAFLFQLSANVASRLPLALSRYRCPEMKRVIAGLMREQSFDSIVCDFLFPALNMPDLGRCVLFEHNVETMIWRRHAETAPDPLRRGYFRIQAERMFRAERELCRAAGHVVAVSRTDAERMHEMFGISHVSAVPTGVSLDYFSPPASARSIADLVFVGSMDWMANIDAVGYFVREVLPLIRRRKPGCTFAVVGRSPSPVVLKLAQADPLITVTGTVADIRPYLWGAGISVVPLRVGSGTRLKIYESMAAKVAVVSTRIGAEGLDIDPQRNIRLGDTPGEFAEQCLTLLENPGARSRMAEAGWEMVHERFSWEQVTREFEGILARNGERLLRT